MRSLIVEDDFTSRVLLQELLRGYGPVHVAVNGREAVEAVRTSLGSREPYDLICLDIMMPDTDGQEALRQIRALEDRHGIQGLERSKVVMTTALKDKDNVRSAFREQCDGYLVKPIRKDGLVSQLRELGLVP